VNLATNNQGHFLMVEIRSSPRREVFSSQKAKVLVQIN